MKSGNGDSGVYPLPNVGRRRRFGVGDGAGFCDEGNGHDSPLEKASAESGAMHLDRQNPQPG
jgi:hypothetical protein